MLADWKTLDTQNISLNIDLSKDDLDDHLKKQLDGYNREVGRGYLLAEIREQKENNMAF